MARIACFGEVLLRLAPQQGVSLRRASGLDVHVGGAEANVAVGLAQLGHQARVISVLPDNDLGALARRRLASEGLDLAFLGTGPGRMGLYFHDPVAGPRGGGVTYDRVGSAFALASSASYDATAALEGVEHLHVSGISPAVSEAGAEATLALVKAAKAKGCTISFDGNFRSQLWAGGTRDPRKVLAPVVAEADLMFGNYRDAGLLLGSDMAGSSSRDAAEAMFAAFPKLQAMVSTQREVSPEGLHFVAARFDARDSWEEADEIPLPSNIERIGTGDAFATGVLHRWLADREDAENALRAGQRLMAIKQATPGDLPDHSPADLEGTIGDIRR
ncbi:sugar kinase [Alteraurantiacibacter aquimixticola]|uniref:Sugar kinase n=1 Tax=Alteraurantiacibacter aquimixticola TaxID=2489173 RepID=A0A4T3F3W9_9SPHN|nr:sugar kinase [Alteraurantiacibacter aquimixticola]TIX50984.1 sugar kinase [Alteraurantiacibacter aquimixticola]